MSREYPSKDDPNYIEKLRVYLANNESLLRGMGFDTYRYRDPEHRMKRPEFEDVFQRFYYIEKNHKVVSAGQAVTHAEIVGIGKTDSEVAAQIDKVGDRVKKAGQSSSAVHGTLSTEDAEKMLSAKHRFDGNSEIRNRYGVKHHNNESDEYKRALNQYVSDQTGLTLVAR